tara:strand:- start:2699 stop:3994 length:1296 start_codon:yes stop_codon:yes gene_type:complete
MKIIARKITKPLKGEVTIPGDKSISHRAIIISSISKGKTTISNLLESEDVKNTINSLKALGVKIIKKNNKIIVYGKGLNSLRKSKKNLYCGNSGTTARLLTGLLASQPFKTRIFGDKSLSKRPMDRIINPMIKMGAKFNHKNKKLPYIINGKNNLKNVNHQILKPSSQIKSGIILACLNTNGLSKIYEKSITRDHTEIMLKNFKSDIKVKKKNSLKIISIKGQKELKSSNIIVPGDFSSASFFIVAALLIKDSKIFIKNINLNPTRTGLLSALKKMNAKIDIKNIRKLNGEKIGDIYVKYSKLKGCNLNKYIAPTMIDEYPILSVAAANAKTASKFYGLEELKIKESNRLLSIKKNLNKFGVKCNIKNNSITINPKLKNEQKRKILINSNKDHRIAMSFFIMGLLSNNEVIIKDAQYIKTSFPNFINEFKK